MKPTIQDRMKRINQVADAFFLGKPFFAVLFFLTCLVPIFDWEVPVVLVYAVLLSVIFVLCDDIQCVFLPVMLLSVFVTKCYNSYDTFMAYIGFAVLPVAAVLFHLIVYRKKPVLGPTFGGLCAVAVAVLLGGMGTLPWADRIGGSALYYILGLSIGMVAAYLILQPRLAEPCVYPRKKKFLSALLLMGALCCVCITVFYFKDLDRVLAGHFTVFQSSNNLSTMLMISMPVPAMLSLKKKRWLPVLFLFAVFIVLTASRGGIVMGGIEFFILLGYLAVFDRKYRYAYLVAIVVLAIGIYFGLPHFLTASYIYSNLNPNQPPSSYYREILELEKQIGESRLKLLLRAWENFRGNILFGQGLTYRGNTDIYNPVRGAMCWYHMWTAQVLGSMGLLGVVAYLYQLIQRIVVTARRGGWFAWGLFLCYGGLFLMSQVNPGEFCPVPYALTAVILFLFIEQPRKKAAVDPTAEKAI